VKNLEDWLKKQLNHPDPERAKKIRHSVELGHDIGTVIYWFILVGMVMAILYIASCWFN